MAKCKFCGAEVAIGARCTYCGSKAESWYYSVEEKKQESKKKQVITLNAEYDDLGAGRKIFRGKYYIVQKGDNLWNIVKVYDNGVRIGVIRTNGRISTIFPDAASQP